MKHKPLTLPLLQRTLSHANPSVVHRVRWPAQSWPAQSAICLALLCVYTTACSNMDTMNAPDGSAQASTNAPLPDGGTPRTAPLLRPSTSTHSIVINTLNPSDAAAPSLALISLPGSTPIATPSQTARPPSLSSKTATAKIATLPAPKTAPKTAPATRLKTAPIASAKLANKASQATEAKTSQTQIATASQTDYSPPIYYLQDSLPETAQATGSNSANNPVNNAANTPPTPVDSKPSKSANTPVQQPENASGYKAKTVVSLGQYAVAAANPIAAEAGKRILQQGGSAMDAAIAVQMVLGLVEPQSSGIGGGAFMLYYDGKKTTAYDGRETAPAAATPKLFLNAEGKAMPFYDAVVGGRSVGVPGVVAMLEMAHKEHGKLKWAQLFEPAIALAENGFPVGPRLNKLLSEEKYLRSDPTAAAYFYDANGQAWPVGYKLKNPELASTLRLIAKQGAKAVQQGPVAQAIIDKVHAHPSNPGSLATEDLRAYSPKKRDPFCTDYTSLSNKQYAICGMPPPSSGAITIGQILGILSKSMGNEPALATASQQYTNGLPSSAWLHHYTEASRLAFADRGQYLADPDFVSAPGGSWLNMVHPSYLATRAKLIGKQSMKTALPGEPAESKSAYAPMPDQVEYGTSHISIFDKFGHALSMTSSIEDAFGARQMTKGFLLNNQLTDFSFNPADAKGNPVANRAEAKKRPRSSMSPTLVFDKASGKALISLGSPGGSMIIHYTAKTLYAMLNWGLNPQEAIDLPNFSSTNGPTVLEEKRFPPGLVAELATQGHEIRETAMTSGLQAIQRNKKRLLGGADGRREGVVVGK